MHLPQLPSQPTDRSGSTANNITPVFALKELVASLYRQQHRIQDLLSSLGFALRSFNNLNQFLELIPMMATRVTDADGAALILFKPNAQVKLEQLHWTDSTKEKHIRRALETAINVFTSSLATAQMVSSATTALDDQVSRHLGANIHLFGTPIFIRHVERGRLYVFSRDPKYTWTEARQKLVRFVADQTAVAVEHDELTVELLSKERLDRELEIGAEIQLQLLPRQCPAIPGVSIAALCQPANRVGGDYYDFIPTNHNQCPLQGNRWAIVVGDVMGKGVPAGLIMTMTRGMLRGEVLNHHSPALILQKLNRVMYEDLENSHRFVTLFYSEYDSENRILYYSNAAHNPPLLWQAKTSGMKRLDTLGMLIGLEAESQYEDAQIQLESGDTIIYYTDGFTDAANQSGDRFNEENLIEAFHWACKHCSGPQAILEYLFAQVQQFIGSTNSNGDDMTLVVLQVH